jgi:hypothetical protein
MKSFQDDPVNEGRSVRFVEDDHLDKRQWHVVIENPRPSMFHPRVYEQSYTLPVGQRPKRIDPGISAYGGLPPSCQDGFKPGSPRARTREENEQIIRKGRMMQEIEKTKEAMRALKTQPQGIPPTRAQKQMYKRGTSLMHHLVREPGAKDMGISAYRDSLRSIPVNLDKRRNSSDSLPSPPKTIPPKLLLTPSEWEKLEPSEPPPSPRTRPMASPLTATQWENMESDEPSPTLQQKRATSLLTADAWEKYEPLDIPPTPRPKHLTLPRPTAQWEEDIDPEPTSPIPRLKLSTSLLPPEKHAEIEASKSRRLVYRPTTRPTPASRKAYYTKALPPTPKRLRDFVPRTITNSPPKNLKAHYDLNPSRDTLYHMIDRIHRNEASKNWHLDPDRY